MNLKNPNDILNLTKDLQNEYNFNDFKVKIIKNFHDFAIKNKLSIYGHELNKMGDVKKGIYEGGFRIWECEKDLFKYITQIKEDIKDKNVLDIGCGSGLNGILSLNLGANKVVFQDYNEEVIKLYTVPNIILNNQTKNSFLIHSDWKDFSENFKEKLYKFENDKFEKIIFDKKFDIIFGSDILYENINYENLINIFNNFLNDNGIVLISTKSYYFGNNGSYNEFIEYVEKNSNFKIKEILKIEDKISSIRYIFQLNK